MFILKLARLRLFLAQFTLKIQISRYIVNKLLFLIIFVEKNLTNFYIKKVKSTEKNMFILKLSRLRLFLAQFTLKIQISRYIVNKLLFLIIFVEKNLTNFYIKKVKSTEKNMFILKLSRLRLFLAQFTLKIQISRYIVNKLLFLIIFIEKNLTNFDIKKVKSTEKTCLY